VYNYNKALTEPRHGLPQVGEGLRDGTSLIYIQINFIMDGTYSNTFTELMTIGDLSNKLICL